MKKLLVLSLVLGIASLASATLSISGYDGAPLQESDVITLVFNGTGEQALMPLWIVVEGPGSMLVDSGVWQETSFTPIPAFIDLSANIPGTTMINSVDPTQVGTLNEAFATMDFHCDGPGDVLVKLVDGGTMQEYASIVVHQIPEPATMALLGLGALVLRRKK